MKRIIKTIAEIYLFLRKRFPLFFFLITRSIAMVVILFILGFAVFGLMALSPGNIVDNYVKNQIMNMSEYRSTDNVISKEQIAEAKARLGLDKPFYTQYFKWLKKVVIEHDLGESMIYRTPILSLLRYRMINSIILNLISLCLITVISFILGIYFSSKAGTKIDLAITFFALFLHAIPGLLLLILLQLFAAVTGLFPLRAYPDFPATEAPVRFVFSYAHHIFLPLLATFLGGIGGTLRMIRATMLDQLGSPYITSLRSRGIPEWRIYLTHAFRNTLNPYITSSANLLAGLFSGSLILEIIFDYPGVGQMMYEAVLQEDVYLVLANIMFISFLILIGMLISDILLAIIDPRIKYKD